MIGQASRVLLWEPYRPATAATCDDTAGHCGNPANRPLAPRGRSVTVTNRLGANTQTPPVRPPSTTPGGRVARFRASRRSALARLLAPRLTAVGPMAHNRAMTETLFTATELARAMGHDPEWVWRRIDDGRIVPDYYANTARGIRLFSASTVDRLVALESATGDVTGDVIE